MCDTGAAPEVWDASYPVARSRHWCRECDRPIYPGTRYLRVNALYDGRWTTYRAHSDCYDLHLAIGERHCGGQWILGDVREAVREHYREEPGLLRRWAGILRARRVEASASGRTA